MIRKLALIFIYFLSFSSCQKGEDINPQLPPETQEGKNTFGFLLNGEVWLPKDPDFNLYGLSNKLYSFYNDSIFHLVASRKTNPNSYFNLVCGKLVQDTALVFNNYSQSKQVTFSEYYYSNSNATDSIFGYFSVQNHQFSLLVKKLDTINHIISGTFEGQLLDTLKNKLANITDGRFDIKY